MKLCEGGDGLCTNLLEADGLCDQHHHEIEINVDQFIRILMEGEPVKKNKKNKKNEEIQMTPAAAVALRRGQIDNFIAAVTPGGIEAQEAAGQRSFVASDRMPVDDTVRERATYEALGFQFGQVLPGQDKIFIEAKLPPGWSKRATSHSMHSNLLDEQKRVRGGIFFKAAFYDYSAGCSLVSRYGVRTTYETDNRKVVVFDRSVPWDGGDDVPRLDIYEVGEFNRNANWEEEEKLRAQALAWLKENFPNYNDVTAYW